MYSILNSRVRRLITEANATISSVEKSGVLKVGPSKDSTFTAPKSKKIKEVKALGDTLGHLDNLKAAMHSITSLDQKHPEVKRMASSAEKMMTKLQSMHTSLADAAFKSSQNHVDPRFATAVRRLQRRLTESLKKKADSVEKATFLLDTREDGTAVAAGYIAIEGLKTDSGHTYDKVWLVVGLLGVNTSGVTLLDRLILPSKIQFSITGAGISGIPNIVDKLLKVENLATSVEGRPVPLELEDFDFKSKLIKSKTVEGNHLVVALKEAVKNEGTAQKASIDLLKQLRGILFRKRPRYNNMITRAITGKPGRFRIIFIFLSPHGKVHYDFDHHTFDELRKAGVPEEALKKFNKFLEDSKADKGYDWFEFSGLNAMRLSVRDGSTVEIAKGTMFGVRPSDDTRSRIVVNQKDGSMPAFILRNEAVSKLVAASKAAG